MTFLNSLTELLSRIYVPSLMTSINNLITIIHNSIGNYIENLGCEECNRGLYDHVNRFDNHAIYFFKVMNKINDNNSSCFLDITDNFIIFKLIYESLDSGYRKNNMGRFFFDFFRYPLIYKDNGYIPMNYRSGVFIKKGYEINNEYLKKITSDKGLTIVDIIPKNEKEMNKINQKTLNKKWTIDENLFDSLPPDNCAVYIKSQSRFIIDWLYTFDDNLTKNDFYIGNGQKTIVNMMHQYNVRYENYITDDYTFVSMPFKDVDYSMLVIMPNKKAYTKNELIQLLSREDARFKNVIGEKCIHRYGREDKIIADDITIFYKYKKPIVYNYVSFPKFEFQSKWYFDNNNDYNDNDFDDNDGNRYKEYCEDQKFINYQYLEAFLNPSTKITNIIKGEKESENNMAFDNNIINEKEEEKINIESVSNIKCNTFGTKPLKNSMLRPSNNINNSYLNINKSFIYIILYKGFIISKMGVFVG